MSSTSPPSSHRRRSSASNSGTNSPSLFSNQHSRGPLYQYWRERNREAMETRQARVLDAKERSRGNQPQYPEPGPSSNSEYAGRLERGLRTPATPAYEVSATDGPVSAPPPRPEEGEDELPSYIDGTTTNSNSNPPLATPTSAGGGRGEFASSAADEKARLQAHYEREQAAEASVDDTNTYAIGSNMQDDATIAAALAAEQEQEQEREVHGKGKELERKKSVGRRVSNFLGAAFTGYNMKSDGKGNVHRW